MSSSRTIFDRTGTIERKVRAGFDTCLVLCVSFRWLHWRFDTNKKFTHLFGSVSENSKINFRSFEIPKECGCSPLYRILIWWLESARKWNYQNAQRIESVMREIHQKFYTICSCLILFFKIRPILLQDVRISLSLKGKTWIRWSPSEVMWWNFIVPTTRK